MNPDGGTDPMRQIRVGPPVMPGVKGLTAGEPAWLAGAGRRIGRYVLGPRLGEGGMGEVFEAWDTHLKRPVALKLLRQYGPTAILRFMNEAQLQARVDHPNICRIFDVDAAGDLPFIAMQMVKGGTLAETCKSLSHREAVETLALVARAVHAAHLLNLVHRDLKPGNILMEQGREGRWTPYVCDFGLAMDMESEGFTRTQAPLGTPAYMAPEQVRGERKRIGPATDVYALGVTLRHTLSWNCGVCTDTADPEPKGADHLHSQAHLPKELRTILDKCAQEEPEDRYTSAAGLAEDLRRYLDGEPILARATSPWRGLGRKIRRNPVLLATGVGVVLLVSALIAWNIRTARYARNQIRYAQQMGAEIKDIEYSMRMERLLPSHDLGPAFARVRERMQNLGKTMKRLGPAAEGPGRYALGRGHMILLEPDQALKELNAAWNLGLKTPDVAYALAKVHCQLYEKGWKRAKARGGEALVNLGQEHLGPAKGYLARSEGQRLEPHGLGASMVARLESDYGTALRLARKVFRENPWCYEAKLAEASALAHMGFECQIQGRLTEMLTHYDAAAKAFAQTRELARSDEGVLAAEMSLRLAWVAVEIEQGLAKEGRIRQIQELAEALVILDPSRVKSHRDRLTSIYRLAEYLLSTGQDPSAEVDRGLRAHSEAVERTGSAQDFAEERLNLGWVLADYHVIHGVDPRSEIENALKGAPGGDSRAEILQTKARWEMEHGLSPVNALEQAIRETRQSETEQPRFWHGYYVGSSYRLLARWRFRQGQDPLPDLVRGEAELRKAIGMNPESSWSWVELSRVFELKGLHALRTGGDPRSCYSEAMGFAEKAIAISPGSHVTHWSLASACMRMAQAQLNSGQDPQASLEQGDRAIRRALSLNPTRAQLLWVRGQLALVKADQLKMKNAERQRALAEAQQSFSKGLASNPSLPDLWVGLAEVQQRQDPNNQFTVLALLKRAARIDPSLSVTLHSARRHPLP